MPYFFLSDLFAAEGDKLAFTDDVHYKRLLRFSRCGAFGLLFCYGRHCC